MEKKSLKKKSREMYWFPGWYSSGTRRRKEDSFCFLSDEQSKGGEPDHWPDPEM